MFRGKANTMQSVEVLIILDQLIGTIFRVGSKYVITTCRADDSNMAAHYIEQEDVGNHVQE